MDFFSAIQDFHLLRPYWLLALLPLALLIWFYARTQSHSRNWASVIDKRLLPHLLQSSNISSKSTPVKSLFILGSLAILALSGPAFEKRPQPVFKAQSALVLVLDLSLSMDATDIKPSRLSRAHFKINDILKQRKEGQTALIAYAADAYIVSPLTDDAHTILSQVPALDTSIMPSQGSRLDIALSKAQELFNNSGISSGHIFVISDSINTQALDVISDLNSSGINTSVLAIGTVEGAPIADHNGGYIKDNYGSIVIPKLNIQSMQRAASLGGGSFSQLTSNDRDINRLLSPVKMDKNKASEAQLDVEGNKLNTDAWHEEGPWLLLLLIPFAAYAFRKGLVFVLLLYILPLPQPAQAFSWSELWNNSDQRGATALQDGDAKQAAELFNDPQWKAAAQYKAQDYQQAAETLNDIDTAEANYNRGNALAKAGQLEPAIKAYQRALQQQPEHEDAKHNLELLKQTQQQSQQNPDNKQSDKDQQENKDSSDTQQSENQKGNQQQNKQQQSDDSSEQSDSQSSQNSENNAEENSDNKAQQQTQSEEQEKQDKNSTTKSEQDKAEEQKQAQSSDNKSKTEDNEQADKEQLHQQSQNEPDSEASPDLNQQKTQQWLKKIPDDPGGLLRNKFRYLYGRNKQQTEQDQW